MRWSELAKDWFALGATCIGTVLLATLLDPYLSLLESPVVASGINAFVPLLVALAVLAIGGRWLPALSAAAMLTATLCAIDHFKMQAVHNNLLFADLKLVPELAKAPGLVVGFARIDATGWFVLLAGLLASVVVVVAATRMTPARRWIRVTALIFATGGVIGVTQLRVSHQVQAIGWMLPMQIEGAKQAGVVGNLLLGGLATSNVKPRASEAAIARFWSDPLVQAAHSRLASRSVTATRPDIVFVQSESLFEPSLLCGFDDAPVLRTLASLPGDGFENLRVPVFGHRTLQTEFEVLTGFPVQSAPQSLFAYYDLVDRPVRALPWHLASLGYRTIALHPSRRSFWRRDVAFPAMGFDTFIDGSAYVRSSDFSSAGWVGDEAMTRTILSALEGHPGPTLLFAVSIENHGPWNRPATPDVERMLPSSLQGGARVEMADYIARARNADRNLAVLLDALKQRKRPTLVVFYGDHLPALSQVFAATCFKDGKRPEAHLPPLRVWSNFELPEQFDGETHGYMLSARLLRAAGLPLDDGALMAGAIADAIQRDPSVGPQDQQRILALYAHVATRAVLEAPMPTRDAPLAFIAQTQANARMHAMQSSGPALALVDDGERVRGMAMGAPVGAVDEVVFALDQRIAAAVLRPVLESTGDACPDVFLTPITVDVLADRQVIARARVDDWAVAIRPLALSGADTLTLRVHRPASSSACARVMFSLSQLLCYSAACDRPGQSHMHAVRAALPSEFTPEVVSLTPRTETDVERVRFMLSRATRHETPYQPLRITADHALFLHPTDDRTAWIEFDVGGLASVDLVPAIQPLDANCQAVQAGGIVGVQVAVDGAVVQRGLVNRDTRDVWRIPLDRAKTLRITADAGNGVTWCDWFGVGFRDVQRAGPDA